jgi:hypothetical protein
VRIGTLGENTIAPVLRQFFVKKTTGRSAMAHYSGLSDKPFVGASLHERYLGGN